jgi:hypothetical protein
MKERSENQQTGQCTQFKGTNLVTDREIIRPLEKWMTLVTKRVDFPASARRNLEDAKLLEAEGRVPNAGYLYGYASTDHPSNA